MVQCWGWFLWQVQSQFKISERCEYYWKWKCCDRCCVTFTKDMRIAWVDGYALTSNWLDIKLLNMNCKTYCSKRDLLKCIYDKGNERNFENANTFIHAKTRCWRKLKWVKFTRSKRRISHLSLSDWMKNLVFIERV